MIAVCLRAQVGMLMEKGIVLAYLNVMELEYHLAMVRFSLQF